MQTVMKKCSAAILLAIALCLGLALPQLALAAPGDPTATVELKAVDASATDVYMSTNQGDTRTFSVALQVKTDAPDYLDAVFVWDKIIEGENGSAASLLWADPVRTPSGITVTLYAGDLANEPFKDGTPVKLGTLKLLASSDAPAGEEVAATVQLLPGRDSVAFAAYRDAERTVPEPTMVPQDGVELTVQANEGTPGGGKDPSGLGNGGAGVNQSPDILGQTAATNGLALATTGDQMLPVIITLSCIAVLAVVTIVVMAVRRKRNGRAADDQ